MTSQSSEKESPVFSAGQVDRSSTLRGMIISKLLLGQCEKPLNESSLSSRSDGIGIGLISYLK